MALIHFKRFRMHFDLRESLPAPPPLPQEFLFRPWTPGLLERHAIAKFESFRNELDANVFPSLSHLEGCLNLMREISGRQTFVPPATWLVDFQSADSLPRMRLPCATIQGLVDANGNGAIQNVGVIPRFRGIGIGTALLCHALEGFRDSGLSVASLEVTAENSDAIRLYQRFGFRIVRTVYKTMETAPA